MGDSENDRNEQLAFVSGTVLAGGALLVKVWPIVSRMHTGVHDQITPARFSMSAIAPVAVLCHRIGALIVALGMGMLLFGTVHVVARGLSLTKPSLVNPSPDAAGTSDRIARRAYLVIQIYWTVIGVALLAGFLTFPVLTGLVRFLQWTPFWASVATTMLIVGSVATVNVVRLRRGTTSIFGWIRTRVGTLNLLIAVGTMFLLWLIAVDFAYVAELSVSSNVIRRAEANSVVVSVSLGGSVSDVGAAKATITRGDAIIRYLGLKPVGRGNYIAVVDSATLDPGDYEVRLVYPHTYVAFDTPTFSRTIDKRVGLIVLP